MGWSASDVGAASIWELLQAYKGFARFHSGGEEKGGAPTDEAFIEATRAAREDELRAAESTAG